MATGNRRVAVRRQAVQEIGEFLASELIFMPVFFIHETAKNDIVSGEPP
jgi:hypothetical protein